MGETNIEISITGKKYPLIVKEEDIEIVRDVESSLNKKINEYLSKFDFNDQLDAVNLVLIDLAYKHKKIENSLKGDSNEVVENIEKIIKEINKKLPE